MNKLDEVVPECDDFFSVDEHFDLPTGTKYKLVVCNGDPSRLNEQHFGRGIRLVDWGKLPKAQLPKWQALMQRSGVGKKYWIGSEP